MERARDARRPVVRLAAALAAACGLGAAPAITSVGHAQPCLPGVYSSNASYQCDPAGTYWAVPNTATRVPTILPDPTVVKIGPWYYVTGTSDAFWVANFVIYKSQDLITWTYHGTAFKETDRVQNVLSLNAYDGSTQPGEARRKFSNLWAPHLYVDGPNVWLSFTATEDRGLGYATGLYPGDDPTRYQSVYAATCSVAAFTGGGAFSFANEADGRGHEPLWHHYQVNNNAGAPGKLDGGLAQGPYRTIPVTGSPALLRAGDPCGTDFPVYAAGTRFGHKCIGANTYMALDSFVYVDPADNNRRWMLYTWVADEFGPGQWDGNHVAGHPMLDNVRMDAAAAGLHLQLAYRANHHNWIGSCCANGHGADHGGMMAENYAVAEAPAAFRWNGWTYLLFSRNAWNSPAYGIFYRKSTGPIASMGLAWGDPNIRDVPEQALLMSANRTLPYGPSYGHGEVFTGPGNRPYLVFHFKGQGTNFRYVYFKELTFDGAGNLATITDGGAWPSATHVSHFLVPK